MQLLGYKLMVLLVILHETSTYQSQLQAEEEYYYDPESDMDDMESLNSDNLQRPKKNLYGIEPRQIIISPEANQQIELRAGTQIPECVTKPICGTPEAGGAAPAPEPAPAPTPSDDGSAPSAPSAPASSGGGENIDQEAKAKELRILVQHLYTAQARVQLEATEIRKAQVIANTAQLALEEASGKVRAISASLQNAQQEVAAAAIRAQTAQLQLAAHDQLLFAARQDVDALSSQMVGLQAAEGIAPPKIMFDVTGLLEKLKSPLSEAQKPTAIPPIVPIPNFPNRGLSAKRDINYD